MSTCHSRLFLLCAVDIKDQKAWADLTTKAAIQADSLFENTWKKLDRATCKYHESPESDFDFRQALDEARNFAPSLNRQIDASEVLNKTCHGIDIKQRDSALIMDEHGHFLFILSYQLSFDSQDALPAIHRLFRNRSVIDNLGQGDFFREMQKQVAQEIVNYVNRLAAPKTLSPDNVELNANAVFPLLFSDTSAPENIQALFKNEENKAQRMESSPLGADYDGAFFHVGWNYTLALRFPREVNEQLFVILTKMQLSYYVFRHYKEYFEKTIKDLAKTSEAIDYEVVAFFDRLRIGYQGYFSQYAKFKLGLYPKYFVELEAVEKLWHVDRDIDLMSELFATQTEFVNKKHRDLTDRINLQQQRTLGAIAILQILALMSVSYDAFQFFSTAEARIYAQASTVLVVLGLILSVVSYLRAKKTIRSGWPAGAVLTTECLSQPSGKKT